jgi:pimeloyl-ACP methyl ester carboxylesterase
MKRLKHLFLLLIGLYICTVIFVYFYQDHLLFFPDSTRLSECQTANQFGFQTIETRYENQNIRYLLKTNPQAYANIIVFHGNASTACRNLAVYLALKTLNLNFVLAAYPGYEGDQLNKPGEKIFLKNGEALFDYLKQQSYGKLPTVLFGRSLGTGEAVYLASVRPVEGLILQTPYSSISEVGAYHYPFLPVSLINQNVFPAYLWAPGVKSPVLLLHGTNDQTIPFKYAQKLARFFKSQVKIVKIEGAGHDDITTWGNGIFWKEIGEFLRRLTPQN